MPKRFGAILPNTQIFGGVKRFLDLGNVFTSRGNDFIIFTPDGLRIDWHEYKGQVKKIEHLFEFEFDALFITDPDYLDLLVRAKSTHKIFYYVLQRPLLKKVLKYPKIEIFVNSTSMYDYVVGRYRVRPFKAFGGVDLNRYQIKESHSLDGIFTVMAYGRISRRRKGTRHVIKACENLYRKGYDIKLLLFDSPVDEISVKAIQSFSCKAPYEFILNHPVRENKELFYRADVFVSAERNAGWSNTTAEAMACGIPVVATASGTKDFLVDGETGLVVWRHSFFIERALKKLILNPDLRLKFAFNGRQKIEEFTWEKLADSIHDHLFNETA